MERIITKQFITLILVAETFTCDTFYLANITNIAAYITATIILTDIFTVLLLNYI